MQLKDITLSEFFPNLPSNEIAELADYQKDLDILDSQKISIQFNNKGSNHAILVMSKIFDSSNSSVKIFARDFNGQISDNQLYLNCLRKFLDRDKNNTVSVIFETDPNEKSLALDLLRKERTKNSKRISLKKATNEQLDEFKKYLVNEEGMIHFTIGDNSEKKFNKYRCETDTRNYTAILNFDDQSFCSDLNYLFKILETNATVVN
jgi:hypothetical protein